MPMTPEQIRQAVAAYNGMPLSSAEGTWASPASAPMVEAPAAPIAPVPAPMEMAPAPPPETAAPMTLESQAQLYRDATRRYGDTVRAGGDAEARGLEEQAALGSQQDAAQAVQDLQGSADIEAADEAKREAWGKVKSLNDQADRARVVDSRTTSQRVMGALAIALGSVGDGFARMGGNTQTNGADQVVGIINNQIERDMKLQRDAIDDKRKSASAALSEYGLARQWGGDAREQSEFATAQIQRRYASQLRQVAARSNSEQARAAADGAAIKYEAEAEGTLAKLAAGREEQMMRSRLLGQRAGLGGGGAINLTEIKAKIDQGQDLTARELKAAQTAGLFRAEKPAESADLTYRKGKDAEEKANKEAARNIPGLRPLVGLNEISDNDVKKAQEAQEKYTLALSNLADMKKMAADWGPNAVDSFETLQGSTVAMLTQAAGSGVPGASEAVKFAKGLPGPTYINRPRIGNTDTVYNTAIDNMRTLQGKALRVYKYTPDFEDAPGPDRSPAGRVRAATRPTEEAQPVPSEKPRPFKVYGTPRN